MQDIWQDIVEYKFVEQLSVSVIFLRLLLAVIFGGIVGWERERKNRPAGFRTHILVCFGAAVVSMVQDQLRVEILSYSVDNSGLANFIKTDLGRLGAQVISGIGFLGAGCIIKERGDIVLGMTTAAGIWATGCVGLGIGWGFYNIALVAIVFMLIVMIGLKFFQDKLFKKNEEAYLKVQLSENINMNKSIEEFYSTFKENAWNVSEIDKDFKNNTLIFNLETEKNSKLSDLIIILSNFEGVKNIKELK